MLTDTFGRTINYLRVSVTDRCNLRCCYCIPPEGVEQKPREAILSFEEMFRLCRLMAGLGIRSIKVTGGEPLVRRGTASFLKSLKSLPGIEKVTLTTNGLLLGAFLDEVKTSGVLPDGVNISLNALDSGRFSRITGTADGRPDEILPFIDLLLEMRVPVKINCVPVRSFNEEDILPLAALARDKDIAVRFIELMPLGSAASLRFIPGGEIAAMLEKRYGALTPFDGVQGSGPAVYYSLPGFIGKTGFINAMTRSFCETCSRLRLTSEGLLKPCLFSAGGLDLRQLLRCGANDSDIARAIAETVAQKPRSYTFPSACGASAARPEGYSSGMFETGG